MKSVLFATVLAGNALMAGYPVKLEKLPLKTLSADTYAKLAKGKNLTWVWKDEGFDASKGFLIGEVAMKSETRSGEILAYLKEQLLLIEKKGAAYTLNVTVVDYSGGNPFLGPDITFEATITKQGKVVAFFVDKEISASRRPGNKGGWDPKPAVDALLGGLEKGID